MKSQCYNVVGVTFENRQDILNSFYKNYKIGGNYNVRLESEPSNPYDKNAIAVRLDVGGADYKHVGYISKQENVQLGQKLGKMKTASLCSMGPNSKGELGLTIQVEFED